MFIINNFKIFAKFSKRSLYYSFIYNIITKSEMFFVYIFAKINNNYTKIFSLVINIKIERIVEKI